MKPNNRLIYLSLLGVLPISIVAETPSLNILNNSKSIIDQQIYRETQKENFDAKLKQQSEDLKSFYVTDQIVVEADRDEIECVEIDKIDFIGSTLFSKDIFDDLKKPYLKNCNGMTNLTNLLNKITNMYIDKGYVTSRAYLKQQDLSDGSVEIDILESKIEKIEFTNTKPIKFLSIYENQILNLKDLEVELQQRDRLKSVDYNIELQPGTKAGYSIVNIVSSNNASPFYGNFGVNNFGSIATGKYQTSLGLNYENLSDLSEIITLNLNGTNNSFKSHNYSNGGSINYSLPIDRFSLPILKIRHFV